MSEGGMTKHVDEALADLHLHRGAVVCSADCSEMEIAFARAEGRFYVTDAGLGFVLRPREWRANAEAALHEIADQHNKDKYG